MWNVGTVRVLTLAPESDSPQNCIRNVTTQHDLYVLKTINFISFRLRTYRRSGSPMKTRHFNPFGIRTYRKTPHNSFVLSTYRKSRGRGIYLSHSAVSPLLSAFCLLGNA